MAVKALQGITITYDGDSLEEHLNAASLQATINAIDTTVLSSSAAEKIPGLGDWTINIGGPWSSTLHGYLNPDVVAPPSTLKTLVVVVGQSGSQVTYTWTTNSFISDYSFSLEPTGMITWTGVLSVSGVPTMS